MTKDEALKLALEALESKYIVNCGAWRVQQDQAITAIKEALAESEARRKEFSETTKRNMEHVEWYLSTHAPEPVAWRYLTRYPTQNVWTYCGSEPETKPEREPLYAIPPQRKPLTDEECDRIYKALDQWSREFDQYEFGLPTHCGEGMVGGRAIIRAAHGIKE